MSIFFIDLLSEHTSPNGLFKLPKLNKFSFAMEYLSYTPLYILHTYIVLETQLLTFVLVILVVVVVVVISKLKLFNTLNMHLFL